MVITTHNAITKPVDGSDLTDPTLVISRNATTKTVKASFDSETEDGKIAVEHFGVVHKIKARNEV